MSLLSTNLRIAALREQIALQEEHSVQLEERHRKNMNALSATTDQSRCVLLCLGREAFVNVSAPNATRLVQRENDRVWALIEETQREVTRLERELLVAEEVLKGLSADGE